MDYTEYEHRNLALTCVTLIDMSDFFLYFYLFWGGGFLNSEDGPDRLSRNFGKKKITATRCVMTQKGAVLIFMLTGEQHDGSRWRI